MKLNPWQEKLLLWGSIALGLAIVFFGGAGTQHLYG